MEMRWFLLVLTDFSAELDLCICGETNCTGNRCKRKHSLYSNEVSLSQMRLGRGRDWAVKKARIDIVKGGFRFFGGEVDIAAVVSDKNVLVAARRFHGQLTGEVRSRGIVAGNSTDKRGAV